MDEADIQRFFAKVDFTENCWIWIASLDTKGYGQFRYNGQTMRSHRIAFDLCKDDLVDGLDLDHLCRNRACVNPEHLDQVDRSTNLLRGLLWQSKKTHCPKGHQYDVITYRARRCSICLKEQSRIKAKRYYWRHKNA